MLFTEINAAAATKALGRDWNGSLNSFTRHSRNNEGKRLSRTVHNSAKQTGRERQSRSQRLTVGGQIPSTFGLRSLSNHLRSGRHTSQPLLTSTVSLFRYSVDSALCPSALRVHSDSVANDSTYL